MICKHCGHSLGENGEHLISTIAGRYPEHWLICGVQIAPQDANGIPLCACENPESEKGEQGEMKKFTFMNKNNREIEITMDENSGGIINKAGFAPFINALHEHRFSKGYLVLNSVDSSVRICKVCHKALFISEDWLKEYIPDMCITPFGTSKESE